MQRGLALATLAFAILAAELLWQVRAVDLPPTPADEAQRSPAPRPSAPASAVQTVRERPERAAVPDAAPPDTAPPLVAPPPRDGDSLLVCGSATSPLLLADVRTAFAAEANVQLAPCDDTAALRWVLAGAADAAVLCARDLPRLPAGTVCHVLGTFVAAVVTHPDNPVRDLGREQLGAAFGGKLADWRALGGHATEVHVIGSRLACFRLLPRLPAGRGVRGEQQRPAVRVRDDASRLRAIREDRGAIGLLTLGDAVREGLRPVTIDGVAPSRLAFDDGTYPLGYRVYLVHLNRPNARLARFLDFVLGTPGTELLARHLEP